MNNSNSKNILLITFSFPYDIGGENTFLRDEIPFYSKKFKKIIILPSQISQTKAEIDSKITIDKSLIEFTKQKKIHRYFSYKLISFLGILLSELKMNFKKITIYKGLKKLIKDYLLAVWYFNFFETYFLNKKKEEWIIYTYWFTPLTIAATLFASKNKNIKVVTRAHGIDLYEFRNNNYMPFRRKTIGLLTKYFFVSETGRKYTEQLYPEFRDKYLTFGLGIEGFNFVTEKSGDGVLRIVSCSSVDENKRVNLIVLSIEKLVSENNKIKIEWNHFGAGPLFGQILDLAKIKLLNNVHFHFHGSVTNGSILEFYKKNKVDLFITTSASEGGRPVSIMEALCFSIPIVATSVGGIPEIVNFENGILLNESPTIEEIKKSLLWFVENHNLVEAKKKAARIMWEKECNASSNFSKFVNYLAAL